MEFDKVNDTINIYFYMGKIYQMVADFEPVILEESGFGSDDTDFDDKIYLQPVPGQANANNY